MDNPGQVPPDACTAPVERRILLRERPGPRLSVRSQQETPSEGGEGLSSNTPFPAFVPSFPFCTWWSLRW
eukprot:180702-Chlamydomonas_euryale.AAC.1